ncbi:MAG: DUF6776 family protein [Pseudomonadota bacterium]
MRDYRANGMGYQRQRRASAVALALLLLLAVVVGGILGWALAFSRMAADSESEYSKRQLISELRRDLRSAHSDLEVQRTRHEVDSQALEMMRRELASQKAHSREVEESVRFYRSLMSPVEINGGIRLRTPQIVQKRRPEQVSYRLVIQQDVRKQKPVEGELTALLYGSLDDEAVSFNLTELGDDADTPDFQLAFRYFQIIEGELTLPEGFTPEELALVANISKPKQQQVIQQFAWQLQERFTHVGQ